MRAARIDENQPDLVKALRAAGARVLSLASVGNGCPDLLVWHPAKGLQLLEVKDGAKTPSQRKLTPDQVLFHALWDGAPITVVTSMEDALAALT